METFSIAHASLGGRPPSRLWYNVDKLPKVVIRDLAHDGNPGQRVQIPCLQP